MPEHPDLLRLRDEYARRRSLSDNSDMYSSFNPSFLFICFQRMRSLVKSLSKIGIHTISDKKILEIGCGSGRVLAEYLSFGAQLNHLFGIDILPNRLNEAQKRLSGCGIACADGQNLPFPNQHFDLILQYTAFSSILDQGIKIQIATEMLRLLRINGFIIWYDFWLNPTNPQTKGIRPPEIRQLFPDCTFQFHKITLAPPITRHIAPHSWIFAQFLESLYVFNTHYLVLIQKISK